MALALNSSAMDGSNGKTMPKFSMSIKTIRYMVHIAPRDTFGIAAGRDATTQLLCCDHCL